MPKRIRTPVPDVAEVMASGAVLTRAEAVALIADRLPSKGITERSRRDKVRKCIAERIAKGAMVEVRHNMVGLAAVAQMAREAWPLGRYDDLPRSLTMPAETGYFKSSHAPATLTRRRARPEGVAECHRVIGELEAEVTRLSESLRAQQERNADLEPDAQRYRDICATNRESAGEARTRR